MFQPEPSTVGSVWPDTYPISSAKGLTVRRMMHLSCLGDVSGPANLSGSQVASLRDILSIGNQPNSSVSLDMELTYTDPVTLGILTEERSHILFSS